MVFLLIEEDNINVHGSGSDHKLDFELDELLRTKISSPLTIWNTSKCVELKKKKRRFVYFQTFGMVR